METRGSIRKIKRFRDRNKREPNTHYNLDGTPKKVFNTREEAEEFIGKQDLRPYGCRTCQKIHVGIE